MEETSSSSMPHDLNTFLSQVRELEDRHKSLEEASEQSPSDIDKLLKDCVLHLESRVQKIVSELPEALSPLGIEDLDLYAERLKEELTQVEAENTKISQEIEVLKKSNDEDSIRVKHNLETLRFSLNHFQVQAPHTAKTSALGDCSGHGDQVNMKQANAEKNSQVLELDNEVEKKSILESLLELELASKRFDVVEEIENTFGGIKVIEVDKNFIKLSLKTHIPALEEPSNQQRKEDKIEPSELNHEVLIEVLEGSFKPKSVKIFPNDVYIDEIFDASKSFRDSSLKWLVRYLQERIILCSLRQSIVKIANNARHIFEYLNREETIVCHIVGGIAAFIKFSQDWPLSNSALKLVSLKSSNQLVKRTSSNFISEVLDLFYRLGNLHLRFLRRQKPKLHKIIVEQGKLSNIEEANSLDIHITHCLPSFADAVEKIIAEHTL